MKFILALIAIVTLNATSASGLTGKVKSETGKPLAGVEILTYAPAGPATILGRQVQSSSKRYEVKTAADGTFSIPSHGQFVFFHRSDLRPLTKMIELTARHVEITMEDGSKSLWNVPACSAQDKKERLGVGLLVRVPANVVSKKDEEQSRYFFEYRAGEQLQKMVNWWDSTSLQPADETLLQSTQFSQRMWKSGDKWGYDFRGTLPNGSAWRWIAIKNGAIVYRGTPKEPTTIFDSMLHNLCLDHSAITW